MDIVEQLGVTTPQKEKWCTNRGPDKDHYCLCTTQTDCLNCNAFVTNLLGQANIVVEAYERMEEENEAMDTAFREMARTVTVIASAVESLYSIAREMRDYYQDDEKTVIPSGNKKLCREIIAEARKIVRAGGGNTKFTTSGVSKK